MVYPYLTIDLDKIERNARAVFDLCARHGIEVTGVTKCVRGSPQVARAMLRDGVASLGDSRYENLERLRAAGLAAPLLQLRLPPLSGAAETIALADMSLNSEIVVLEALSAAAAAAGRRHDVIIMVDLGDRREGVPPADVKGFVSAVRGLPDLRIVGLGANLACLAGVVPTEEGMRGLVDLAEETEAEHDLQFRWISGVNSSGLDLIRSGRMPARINHARIGEAILLGRETIRRDPWPETQQDAFLLHAEILELKKRPSPQEGEHGEDAFGHHPTFADQGERMHALLNVGREDADIEGLTPCRPDIKVIGGTSGYLVADVDDSAMDIKVGDELAFQPNYSALLTAMTSEYVKKRYSGEEG